jgi:hypothetical protein
MLPSGDEGRDREADCKIEHKFEGRCLFNREAGRCKTASAN